MLAIGPSSTVDGLKLAVLVLSEKDEISAKVAGRYGTLGAMGGLDRSC